MQILVLNSGSSTQKTCLYDMSVAAGDDPISPLWQARIEWAGDAATIEIRHESQQPETIRLNDPTRAAAVGRMLQSLTHAPIAVVGHRVVHGGEKFEAPCFITPEVKSAIAALARFAPLHNRAALEGIEIIEKLLGPVPQVAVFDTGFHKTLPPAHATYPGPYEWLASGIRRYGFHGINHAYCARRAAGLMQRERELTSLKLVSCHLGNGCSLAAVHGGESVDTTMGFTPLEGLMMGTRSGSVDPGILTYLMRERNLGAEELDRLLNKSSGLLGISGVSGDMREIESLMNSGHERAKLAFDMFVHRLQSGIGAMIAVLGGIDALIFTAGIGENSAAVRAAACANFGFAGLKLDPKKNANSPKDEDQDIAADDSPARILVIHAEEDWEIARNCYRLMHDAKSET